MSKILGKSINAQVINGEIEPRPVCTMLCGMACDSNGCRCDSHGGLDPRPQSLNDEMSFENHMYSRDIMIA